MISKPNGLAYSVTLPDLALFGKAVSELYLIRRYYAIHHVHVFQITFPAFGEPY